MNAIELAEWLEAVSAKGGSAHAAAAELRRLHAENESLRRDAGRYKFAKQNIRSGYNLGWTDYYLPDDPDEWDEVIDAAMGGVK